jgi:hypothetical protein
VSAGIVLAGATCSGVGYGHAPRYWTLNSERQVAWRGPRWEPLPDAVKRALTLPVPGSARVVMVDAWRGIAVLSDGSAFVMDVISKPPIWRTVKEGDMKGKAAAQLVCGGTACGGSPHTWVVDSDRRAWVWSPGARAQVGAMPIPGTARIVVVDAARGIVILDDGSAYLWAESWVPWPSILDTNPTVKVKGVGITGVSVSTGTIFPGEVLEVPVGEAIEQIRRGRCVVVAP